MCNFRGVLRLRSKLGQISIFILVGVVLLLGVGLFLLINQESVEAQLTFEPTQLSDLAEVSQVQTYVLACFERMGEEALHRAGQQGGHVIFDGLSMRASYSDPTSADAFFLTPNSQNPIPYWFYLSSPNACDGDCQFFSRSPPLTGPSSASISSQLSRYTELRMVECINEFAPFEEFVITPRGEMRVNTLIRENDVLMRMDYPLDIAFGDSTAQVSEFVVDFDVPLMRMYDLAAALTQAQIEYRYLESQAIEVLVAHTGMDSNKMPPFGDSSFNFASSIYWSSFAVEQKLQQLLQLYTPALQVRIATNYQPITVQAKYKDAVERMFDNMVLPVTDPENRFGDMSVNFEYLGWPMYFDVNDNAGIIQPDSIAVDYFPFFGIQRYRTYYDFSYPVRVVLRNADALSQTGYTFVFGLESNVRDNEALTSDYIRIGENVFGEVDPDLQTELCRPDSYNTGEYTVLVYDTVTGLPLPGAAVVYACGDVSCPVGQTNADGVFTGQLPICGGGFLSALVDEYVSAPRPLSTSLDSTGSVDMALQPYIEKNVRVVQYRYSKVGSDWMLIEREADLALVEEAIITLNAIDGSYSTVAQVSGSAGPGQPSSNIQNHLSTIETLKVLAQNSEGAERERYLQTIDRLRASLQSQNQNMAGGSALGTVFESPNTIRIVPGIYDVSIQVLHNDRIYIPEERRRVGSWPSERTIVIDALDMSEFVSGTLNLDATTTPWRVTNQDLLQGDTIVFKVITLDLPGIPVNNRRMEDLAKMNNIERLVSANLAMLMPEVRR